MNRLQKKCLIATTGFHLLLVVILIVGPGFFTEKPKPDDSKILVVIPTTAIDAAFSSGVKAAQPPPPAPIIPPSQPIVTPPTPTPPKPEVTPPPEPKPEPQTFVKKMEDLFKPDPIKPDPEPTPVPKPAKVTKPKKRDIQISLTPVTRTTTTVKNTAPQKTDDSEQKEAQREAQRQARAIASAARAIKNNSSKATTVDAPGDSTVSYANYGQIVKSIYDQAWTPPDDLAGADENVRVHVVISRDGTVISARIISSSSDSKLDNSVQRVLDRVQFIQAFPEGSTDKERSYNINFNPKTKQLIG